MNAYYRKTHLRSFLIVVSFLSTLLICVSYAAAINLTWDPVTAVGSYPVKGYKIHYGTSHENYTKVKDVGNVTTYNLCNLGLTPAQEYYFVVVAYTTIGEEGFYSSERSWVYSDKASTARVTSITSSTPNGSYTTGEDVDTTVNFSETVTLAGGNLVVALNTARTIEIEPFTSQISVSGNYTVQAGDNSSDLNADSLTLSGGTLQNAEGVDCSLSLPTGSNLADNKDIMIDTTPPVIDSVNVSSTTSVQVVFSEPVEESSAETVGNYNIDKGITINNATLDANLKTVSLYTSSHTEGEDYTITINNIKDRSPTPDTIPPNSTAQYSVTTQLVVSTLNPANYQTVYLDVRDRYYVDRDYTITSIPTGYERLLWIKTANDDKRNTSESFLTFTVNQHVTVYVAYDSRASTPPNWITRSYTNTGSNINVDDGARTLNIWRNDYFAGTIILGGNSAIGASGSESMYALILKPSTSGDTNPPAYVSAFTAATGDSQVSLSWTNSTDDDFVGTMICYRTDGAYPTDHSDGTLVCDRKAAPGSEDSFPHPGLQNGTTYYYSAFSYDEVPNYSEAAHASATPTASGPPIDTIAPTVTITQPTSADIYITDQSTITLRGTASDNVGVISVTWTNSRGDSGTASGTTDWTIFAIPLNCGKNNVITVTAKDAANNAGSATLTVDMNPCPVSGLGL